MIRKYLRRFRAGGVIVNCYRVLDLSELVKKGGWALNKVAEGSAAEEAVQMPTGTINMCSIVIWGVGIQPQVPLLKATCA